MRMEITDIEAFKAVFKNIDSLSDNINLICTTEEMKFNLLDRTHTTFIGCTFEKAFFNEYDVTEEETYSVSASEFNKVLKKCKGTVMIEFDESLIVHNGSKKFKLNLLEPEYDNTPSMPTIPYKYNVNVPVKFYKESLSDCLMFSGDIEILTDEDKLVFASDGMLGAYTNSYDCDKQLESSKAKFSIEKLQMANAEKINDTVNIKGGDDMPVLMEITNPSGLKFTCMVAPKIGE